MLNQFLPYLKIKCLLQITLMCLMHPVLSWAVTVEKKKLSDGSETIKQGMLLLKFQENHQSIGYLTVFIGALMCTVAIVSWRKKTRSDSLSLVGTIADSKSNIKIKMAFEVAVCILGTILVLTGLILAKLSFSLGAVI